MRSVTPDLGAMLAALVAAPVEAQVLMDAHWEADAARWGNLVTRCLADVPPPWRGEAAALLAPTVPLRLVVRRYELDCRVSVRVERRLGVSLTAKPVELGFELLFGDVREAAARVVALVEVVPVPAAPSVTAELAAWTDLPFERPDDEGAR